MLIANILNQREVHMAAIAGPTQECRGVIRKVQIELPGFLGNQAPSEAGGYNNSEVAKSIFGKQDLHIQRSSNESVGALA